MSEEQLKYALDLFVNQTKGSHEKAYKMILFHDSQLKIYKELFPLDQDYIKMYDSTHPLMLDVELKFNSISATEWDQWSQTGTVNNFVKSLQGSLGKAHDWENRTAAVYGISNPMRFKQIWGVGLKKFNGTNAEAIGALLALSTAIGADANPLMIAIKAEVDAAYAIGNPAHHTQEEKIGHHLSENKSAPCSLPRCHENGISQRRIAYGQISRKRKQHTKLVSRYGIASIQTTNGMESYSGRSRN